MHLMKCRGNCDNNDHDQSLTNKMIYVYDVIKINVQQ